MRLFHVVIFGSLIALCSGCEETLQSNLTEQQANDVIVALRGVNILANKESTTSANSEHPTYDVKVTDSELGRALEVLRAYGLPNSPTPGFNDLFKSSGLVPTVTEERARYVSAMAGELSETVKRIDGVLDARVHLAIPDKRELAVDQAPTQARSSVLIKYRPPIPPYDPAHIQALIAGAVQDLPPENVTVIGVQAQQLEANTNQLVRMGPITLTRGSAQALRMVLVGVAGLTFVLVMLVIVALRRGKHDDGLQAPPNF